MTPTPQLSTAPSNGPSHGLVAALGMHLAEYAELVKFEHTIFALPFALSAVFLSMPANQWPPLMPVFWILLAMVGGRTYAMALNRLLDADIDAKNPRTAQRAIPAGRVKRVEGVGLAILSLVVLTVATFQLPPLCQQLLPVAVFILSVYSLTKRFTPLAHWVLGFALGCSVVGSWIAITGNVSLASVALGLAITFWVGGFDIIYSCQDADFDQQAGLHSIPAWLGIPVALRLSKLCHGVTLLCMVATNMLLPQPSAGLWVGTAIMAGFLIYEHRIIARHGLAKLDMAFFTINGWISVAVFASIFLEHLIQWGWRTVTVTSGGVF